jgi:hypothetical protein
MRDTMTPKPETIDRLLLSRSLIAPLRFKPASDRFAVAAHVLAVHDAAELAIAAICSECSVPNISDTRALGLPDYLGVLKQHQHSGAEVSGRDYISKLNRLRVDLKHHGITPDRDQWKDVAQVTFDYISAWCKRYLNIDYAELDAVDLIHSDAIRHIMGVARKCIREDKFRECFEKLAEAIAESSSQLFPSGVHVVVGQADAETALTVSAYGVDPGRFLALQRLLPFYGFPFPEPQWTKRQYGHEANWNRPSAEFAYEETVNLLTRLQGATPYPTPSLYEQAFSDVLVVKNDSPEITMLEWGFDGWVDVEFGAPQFVSGDRIKCRARGTNSMPIEDPDQCNGDPDRSVFVVAVDPKHSQIDSNEGGMPPALVFRREDIDIDKEPLYDEEYFVTRVEPAQE